MKRSGKVRLDLKLGKDNAMAMIEFKAVGKGNGFHNAVRGWFALAANHPIHEDGTHFLSAECVRIEEAEEEARILHNEIDKALAKARRKFRERKT